MSLSARLSAAAERALVVERGLAAVQAWESVPAGVVDVDSY
ncbi:MAG TPA: hypothetical protein RMF84_03370 [Polyangiaceae bacterium LLY-WYZ-14_1]|nr:hypothetical protein [Polyangiaceae bacterium LLY-WYZ-14_1]